MTIPADLGANLPIGAGSPLGFRYGVALAVFPAAVDDSGRETPYTTHVRRAPDSGGSPNVGAAEVVGILVPGEQVFVDELPNDGATRWYSIAHTALGESLSAYTDWVSASPKRLPPVLRAPAPVAPIIREQPSETTTTGTLTLVITDPQLRLTLVEFQTQIGTGAWSGWVTDGTVPYSVNVALVEGNISKIAYRVTGYDALGRLRVLDEKVVPFSIGNTPGMPALEATFDAAGVVSIAWTGDSDTASIRMAGSTSSQPDAATTRTATAYNGRTGIVVGSTYDPGARLYISVFAYSAAGGTGLESQLATVIVDRQGTGYGRPRITFRPSAGTNDTTENVELTIVRGEGTTGTLQWRYRYWGNYGETPTAFSGWSTTNPAVLGFTRHFAHAIKLEVEYTDGTSTFVGTYFIDPRIAAVDKDTGRKRRGVPNDDGDHDWRSDSTNGHNGHPNNQDSTGIPVNRAFKKASSGTADDQDAVADGSTYKRTTATQRDGGGLAATAFTGTARLNGVSRVNVNTVASVAWQQSTASPVSWDGTTELFTVATHTVRVGGSIVTYNSGTCASGDVSGVADTFYIWAQDDEYAGGSVTYFATLNSNDFSGAGKVYIGKCLAAIGSNHTGTRGGANNQL